MNSRTFLLGKVSPKFDWVDIEVVEDEIHEAWTIRLKRREALALLVLDAEKAGSYGFSGGQIGAHVFNAVGFNGAYKYHGAGARYGMRLSERDVGLVSSRSTQSGSRYIFTITREGRLVASMLRPMEEALRSKDMKFGGDLR